MYCGRCGAQIAEAAVLCDRCGGRRFVHPADLYGGMPMKWYKFIICFEMLANAVVKAFTALQLLGGWHCGTNAGQFYETYRGLRALDVLGSPYFACTSGRGWRRSGRTPSSSSFPC